jgi:hypothetical protein
VLLGNSRREGFLLTAAEALSCGVPVVVTRTCGVADFVREGVNGCLIDWDEDPRRLAEASYQAILRAGRLNPMACLESAADLSLQARYRAAHGQTLAHLTHTSLQHEDARVTIGVRIHKNTRVEHLDDAISSLAGQNYRRFKTVLLVDGPWSFGEALAERFGLPLICTGMEPDMTHCSWLHRQAVEQCDTEFYKPLDYDDQLLPGYLERAITTLDRTGSDVYGCLLWTNEGGEYSARKWPHKPLDTMFTGNSDDNMLPHSSVLMKTAIALKAGNYQEKAVGLGADDYHLWYRIHKAGGKFIRDDESRNVAYRIHEKNTLKLRKQRYARGTNPTAVTGVSGRGKIWAGAAAASVALWLGPKIGAAPVKPPQGQSQMGKSQMGKSTPPAGDLPKKPQKQKGAKKPQPLPDAALLPPHS